MKISPRNNMTFLSKNKKIKEADRILRKTAQIYPMLSGTYVGTFYYSDTLKMRHALNLLDEKVIDTRDEYFDSYEKLNEPYGRGFYYDESPKSCINILKAILETVKKTKVGNCEEHAVATYAVLCANGYIDSQKMSLYYETSLIDKKTGETILTSRESLDHTFVLTSMDKNIGRKKDVVVDYWLGFADSKSCAIGKFKEIYSKKDLEEAEEKNIISLKMVNKGDLSDCEFRSRMIFAPRISDRSLASNNAGAVQKYFNENLMDLVV